MPERLFVRRSQIPAVPSPRSRRDLLLLGTAALASLAGCSATDDGRSDETTAAGSTTTTSTDSTTATDGGTATTRGTTATGDGTTTSGSGAHWTPPLLSFSGTLTAGGAEARIENPRHRHALFWLAVDSSYGDVWAFPDGKQGLLLDAGVTGGSPEQSAFAVRAGGERYPATLRPVGKRSYQHYNLGEAYDPGEGTGWLAFVLPVPLDAEDAVLTLDYGGETDSLPLSESVADVLRQPPPSFELRSFEAPESVVAGRSFEVAATVHNDGDGPGTFRAAVDVSGSHSLGTLDVDLPAGGTGQATEGITDRATAGEAESSVTVSLSGPGVSASATVDVR